MVHYIVYSYYVGSTTKYIRGIYNNINDAKNRQIDLCECNGVNGVNGSMSYGDMVTFVNSIPDGSCNVELFTTSENHYV